MAAVLVASAQADKPNLLGQANTAEGENRRNENVQFNLIDNNAQKDNAIRLGTSATSTTQFDAERNYFGSEFGAAPSAGPHVAPRPVKQIHGQLFYRHLNSVLSARSFFQAGGVQPARENEAGAGLTMPAGKRTHVHLEAALQAIRGNVNGNVLIPLPSERTPLATDPALASAVRRILSAYPDRAPNRSDIDPRMLNTNSPQLIDSPNALAQIDHAFAVKGRVSARYQFIGQDVTAFQLIRGQNPDTTTKSHRANLTYSRDAFDATLSFTRAGALLMPENQSVGVSIFVGSGALATILGQTNLPVDRVQNDYRTAFRGRWKSLRYGGEFLRRQLNGYDSDNHLGTFTFRANSFGGPVAFDPITALRLGRPTGHFRSIGEIHRGFRNNEMALFAGNEWKPRTNLTITAGGRWRPVLKPDEVHGRIQLPYRSDWNNVGPSAGLALRTRAGVWRASYAIHFGEIFPATYQQDRFSPPYNNKLIINDPDLLNPLAKLQPGVPRGVLYAFDNNLVSPYSQQYTLNWQKALNNNWTVETAYVGSRTWKLLLHWYENRARAVPGIPLTTATVNERRPDPRYTDIRKVYGSARAYYDAGRVTLRGQTARGMTIESSYWLSKNIDTGSDYLNTAYDLDSFRGLSQSEADVSNDLRALGRFDQPHAFLTRVSYPVFKKITIGAIALMKSGTPFTVVTGADAPGFGNVDGNNNDRPNILRPEILGATIGHPDEARTKLPRSAFSYIRPGEMTGNLGRNTFRRGKIANVNASLERAWKLAKEYEVRLRGESVNFFNTPQFAEPGLNLADNNFGSITNTLNEGRTFRFQLALRF